MKQNAIIVDIDGTLADSPQVAPFRDGDKTNWAAWMSATAYSPVNEWCREIVNNFALSNYKIIFLTARSSDNNGKKITEDWLKRNVVVNYELHMRDVGDTRPDMEMKREVFTKNIAPYYNVVFAVDDKRSVVDMWRDLGIT